MFDTSKPLDVRPVSVNQSPFGNSEKPASTGFSFDGSTKSVGSGVSGFSFGGLTKSDGGGVNGFSFGGSGNSDGGAKPKTSSAFSFKASTETSTNETTKGMTSGNYE